MRDWCRRGALGLALATVLASGCGERPVHRGRADGGADRLDGSLGNPQDAALGPRADGRGYLTDSTLGRPCTDGAICSDAGIIVAEPSCGDGRLNQLGEVCDDGNPLPGDGCSGICALEPNAVCPKPGQPCQSAIVCGDPRMMDTMSIQVPW